MKTFHIFSVFAISDRIAFSSSYDTTNVRGSVKTSENRQLQLNTDVTFTGACEFVNVVQAYENAYSSGKYELTKQLGLAEGAADDEIENAINLKCASVTDKDAMTFSAASNKGYQFDQNYFDGGTEWNQEIEKNKYDGNLAVDAGRIPLFYNSVARRTQVNWPGYIPNFDDTSSCNLRTVMCCWVSERKGQYDPIDNSDVCVVDMERSPRSNHVAGGFTIYDGGKLSDKVYCNGFAWSNDPDHFTNRFKGNTLFYTSMYKHFYEDGYVKNVPGAPMCGCAEQMPIVTHSDCTSTIEGYTFAFDENTLTVSLNLTFEPCENGIDLASYYGSLVDTNQVTVEEKDKLDEIIVGKNNCKKAVDKFLVNKFLVRGDPFILDEKAEYVGCFKDKGQRALPTLKGRGKSLTECAMLCDGYSYFGRQYSGECWCGGETYNKYGEEPSGCDCDGGNVGSWRNCVYKYI